MSPNAPSSGPICQIGQKTAPKKSGNIAQYRFFGAILGLALFICGHPSARGQNAPIQPVERQNSQDSGAPKAPNTTPYSISPPKEGDGAEATATSQLSGHIFETQNGNPMGDITVGIEGGPTTQSDGDGYFRLALPPGLHQPFIILSDGQKKSLSPIHTAHEQVTEWLITVDGQNQAVFESREAPPAAENAPNPEAPLGPPGILVGFVHDKAGNALEGATIIVRGSEIQIQSDKEGQFRLELPPTAHFISLILNGYDSRSIREIPITSGRTYQLDIQMDESSVFLPTFAITAPRIAGGSASLIDEKKESTALTEVMGSEEMARSGDSNAASALRRVTGLTVVGGKYVYVRGLGERYSSAQLNGASLPSPEPERRVVPLDLFGASVLESMVIQKTYAPDMPGEFGGGAILLRTRQYPDEALFKASLSLGYESGATFQEGLSGPRGPWDALGFGRGFRALQSPLAEAIAAGEQIVPQSVLGGYSAAELQAFGQSIENRWQISPHTLPTNLGVGLTQGNKWETPFGEHGYLFSLTYSNTWDHDIYTRTNYGLSGGELTPNWSYTFAETSNAIRLGGLFNYGIKWADRHALKFTTTLSRNADAQSRQYTGEDPEGVDLLVYRNRWVEQQLLLQQVAGTHRLSAHAQNQLDWRYTIAKAHRVEPDRRTWRYDLEWVDPEKSPYQCDTYDPERPDVCGVWIFSNSPDNNEIFYNELADLNQDIGIDFTQPFTLGQGEKKRDAQLKIGAVGMSKTRQSNNRRLYYNIITGTNSIMPDDWRTYDVDEIFADPYIDPNGVQIGDATQATDTYSAQQKLGALYAKVDLPLTQSLGLSGGLRYERSHLSVSTVNPFDISGAESSSGLTTSDLLPALNLTQSLGPRMQLRAAYGRTLSRPDFREMSELTFFDVAGDFAIQGNPQLTWVKIDNLDMRWEFYPTEGETLSVAAFYKKFHDPIEAVAQAGAEPILSFENAVVASNFGVEFDARLYLDLIEEKLADFYIAGNLSLIRSQITLLPEQAQILTSLERPLQGQSPYVANGQLGYDNQDQGITATLLYNVFGPRIATVGVSGAPDIFELPIHQLDLVYAQRLSRGFKISVKAGNLLNAATRRSQDTSITLERLDGRTLSLGLSWSPPR